MNKVWLILKREYVTRVKNKTFLLSTFLLPIVMILFIFGSAFFAITSKEKLKKIAVVNDPGYFKNNLNSDSSKLLFDFTAGIDSSNFKNKGYDAVLDLSGDSTAGKFMIYSTKQLGIDAKSGIEDQLDKAYEKHQLQQKGISKEMLDNISRQSANKFSIDNRVANEKGG